MKLMWIAVGVVAMAVALSGCSTKAKPDSTDARVMTSWDTVAQSKLDTSVSVVDLATAYMDNIVAADSAYKDRVVEVLGQMGKPDVRGGETFVPVEAVSLSYKSVEGVRCFVNMEDAAQKDAVAKSTSYRHARVRGIVRGVDGRAVVLRGCLIDVETLGTAAADIPTIPFPVPAPRGTPAACAMLDTCCPSEATTKDIDLMCTLFKSGVRNKSGTGTCDTVLPVLSDSYKKSKAKLPAGCKLP